MESLGADRNLLDPKFEGYKLSSRPLSLRSTNLISAVNDVPLREDLFSLQHFRAFGNFNHAVLDSWIAGTDMGTEVIYFVDENHEVQRVVVNDKEIAHVENVFKIPASEKTKENLNVTLFFPSDSVACLSDGHGKLYLLQTIGRTKGRGQDSAWKVITVYQCGQPSLILHAIQNCLSGFISCLLLSITENETANSVRESHVVHLDLITFSKVTCSSPGDVCFSFEDIQQFRGNSAPMYAAIEPMGSAILVASEMPFSLLKESEEASSKDIQDEAPNSKAITDLSKIPYKWSQDTDDVTVTFDVPDGTSKEAVVCNIKADNLDLTVGQEVVLRGPLFARVNAEESMWTLDSNRLELVLIKQVQEHHWSSVVKGDDRGEYELIGEEADRVKEIHKRLEHLSSDKLDDTQGKKSSFNDQELEECDAFPEDIEYIFRLDVKTGEVTHKVCLASHQWIFNATLDPRVPPAFCIRHNVDALLWQPKACSDSSANWTHIGTFNALGYVQAAKQDRKFSTCAPDMTYATLCDCTKHIYVYWQPVKGAKQAEQQVVTLQSPDNEILGLQTSNKRIYVLTKQSFHVVCVED